MLKLKHESTTDTGLVSTSLTHQCSISSDNFVFYVSETGRADDYKFHFCDKKGKPTGRSIDATCHHNDTRCFVRLTVRNTEYLCVACEYDGCRNIRLVNLETSEVTVAYNGVDVECMCQGEANTLYILERYEIYELDTSHTDFTLRRTLPEVGMEINIMCYIKEYGIIVLSSSDEKRVCAMRSSDGLIVWDTSTQQINGKKCSPVAVVYLPQVDLVLVRDKKNRGLIAVAAGSGDVIQTIGLKEDGGSIVDLLVRDGQLIVLHSDRRGLAKFSFCSVSTLVYNIIHLTTFLVQNITVHVSLLILKQYELFAVDYKCAKRIILLYYL